MSGVGVFIGNRCCACSACNWAWGRPFIGKGGTRPPPIWAWTAAMAALGVAGMAIRARAWPGTASWPGTLRRPAEAAAAIWAAFGATCAEPLALGVDAVLAFW